MYTITFYSFKGGVGRSMALANVGAHLARNGHRVLLVDFDLEAPGLHTFHLGSREQQALGIVDFVTEYLETNETPDVERFISPCKLSESDNGQLWLMPAGGLQDYQAKYTSLNWKQLYADRDGYLLLEDLKKQWFNSLRPDYVLIDSRTGYTDIGGICTRQLPDAVCLHYFPNLQNFLGIQKVVSEIRLENESRQSQELGKAIEIFLVASNVPDLDDENEILSDNLRRFETLLARGEPPPSVLHHYQSLSLLAQSVFTIDRPRSRLSREYEDLASRITSCNLEDRKVAVKRLSGMLGSDIERYASSAYQELQPAALDSILRHHPDDGEIAFLASRRRREEGDLVEARLLVERAIGLAYRTPESLLELAALNLDAPDKVTAKTAVSDLLNDQTTPLAGVGDISRAVAFAAKLDLDRGVVASAPSIRRLVPDDVQGLLKMLEASPAQMAFARAIAEQVNIGELDEEHRTAALGQLGLVRIGCGDLAAAIDAYRAIGRSANDAEVADAFNEGMARYWLERNSSIPFFERVVQKAPSLLKNADANVLQCLAFSQFVLGEIGIANEYWAQTKERIGKVPRRTFSCWRYYRVTPKEFLLDLEEMQKHFAGADTKPRFFDVPTSR